MNKRRKRKTKKRERPRVKRRMVVSRMNKYEIQEMRDTLREREINRILKKIKEMNDSISSIAINFSRLKTPDIRKNWNDSSARREIEEALDNLNKRILPEAQRDLEFIFKAFDYIRFIS